MGKVIRPLRSNPMTPAVPTVLGGEFEIAAIDGTKQKVKVPEGTQNGRQFRLRDKGMPVMQRRTKGNMYVEVVVEIPQKLNKKQKELLKKFGDETSEDNNPQAAGFIKKIKNMFG